MSHFLTFFYDTIQKRLVWGFLLILSIFGITFLVSAGFISSISGIIDIRTKTSGIESNLLKLINNDHQFVTKSRLSNSFYANLGDEVTREHRRLYHDLIRDLKDIQVADYQTSVLEDQGIVFREIQNRLKAYDSLFNTLVTKQLRLGYKDFGLIGMMRERAHALEASGQVPLDRVFLLRRHEKDFLLRHQVQYIHKFNHVLTQAIFAQRKNRAAQETIDNLIAYQANFRKVAWLSTDISGRDNQGVIDDTRLASEALLNSFNHLSKVILKRTDSRFVQLRYIWYIAIAISLVISLVFSYFFSSHLSKPIKRLTIRMRGFLLDIKRSSVDFEELTKGDSDPIEIRQLQKTYTEMVREIRKQYNETKMQKENLEQQYRQVKKLNAELDRFVYSTSHDLRSPLVSLAGLLSLQKDEKDESVIKEYHQLMDSTIQRMDNTISDIVNYYRNKNADNDYKSVQLRQFFDKIVSSLKYSKNGQSIYVDVLVDDELQELIDERRWRIVFENLISNAINYLDLSKEHPFIRIEVRVNSGYLDIIVEDNGLGIPTESQHKVFDMFYRAHDGLQGSGLGLYLVKECLNRMKGEMFLDSQMGRGTIFTVRIPRVNVLNKNTPTEVLSTTGYL